MTYTLFIVSFLLSVLFFVIISQSTYADRNWIEVDVNGLPINYECHMVVKVKAKAHRTPPSKSVYDKERQKKKLSIWKRQNWKKL